MVSDVIGASKCYVDHFNSWLFGDPFPTALASPNRLRVFADRKFAQMDRDSSGSISAGDALEFFRELQDGRSAAGGLIKEDPQLDTDSFFVAHDTNTDGLVSKAEFDSVLFALWTPRMAKVAAATSRTQPVSYFFQADENGDDYVTEEEFQKAYPDIAWSAVLEYDDDSDGKLFQGEFHAHTRRLYKLLAGKAYDLDADMEGAGESSSSKDDDEEDEASEADPTTAGTESDELPRPTLPLVSEPPMFPGGIKALSISLDHEEALRKLWQIGQEEKLPVSPRVVSQLSATDFLGHARRGLPLIVADGITAATNMSLLSCEAFKREFSAEPLKMCTSPAAGTRCSWKTLNDVDPSQPSRYWEYQGLGQNTVIGGEEYERSKELETRMQEATEMPYFVPKSEINTLLHQDHLHFFFGTYNSSRGPFSDMNCFWSLFGQAHGSSRWKLTVPYNVRQLQLDNPGYQYWPPDGAELVPRMVAEHPVFEFSLSAGQMLVLPPGLLKHFVMTEASGCSVLFRTAFMDPPPVDYVRALHEPLMSDSDGAAGCYTDHYNKWLFGSPLPDSDGSPDGNELFSNGVFAALDADGNNGITTAEATEYFPPKSEHGAIRTPELDAAAFLLANDADQNGSVSLEELSKTVAALWSPVIRQVGGMWYFVDSMNALSGGSWPEYGRYVDSIRFRFEDSNNLEVDEEGTASVAGSNEAEASVSSTELPLPLPPGGLEQEAVPAGFPIVVKREGDDVVLVQTSGELGFLLWPRLGKSFVGSFRAGKRRGTGVFCCKGDDVFDQLWEEGEDDGSSFALEPAKDEEVTERSENEVVNDIPGLLWMGPMRVDGVCVVHWKKTGQIYVGPFVRGRREGPGVLMAANGAQTLVNWLPGQDQTDWIQLLQLPQQTN